MTSREKCWKGTTIGLQNNRNRIKELFRLYIRLETTVSKHNGEAKYIRLVMKIKEELLICSASKRKFVNDKASEEIKI